MSKASILDKFKTSGSKDINIGSKVKDFDEDDLFGTNSNNNSEENESNEDDDLFSTDEIVSAMGKVNINTKKDPIPPVQEQHDELNVNFDIGTDDIDNNFNKNKNTSSEIDSSDFDFDNIELEDEVDNESQQLNESSDETGGIDDVEDDLIDDLNSDDIEVTEEVNTSFISNPKNEDKDILDELDNFEVESEVEPEIESEVKPEVQPEIEEKIENKVEEKAPVRRRTRVVPKPEEKTEQHSSQVEETKESNSISIKQNSQNKSPIKEKEANMENENMNNPYHFSKLERNIIKGALNKVIAEDNFDFDLVDDEDVKDLLKKLSENI